ncbi:MAG: hypothetical protein ACI9HA_001559 [Dinoroseobacter sp.]
MTCSLGLAALRALRVGAALGGAITVSDIAVTASWVSALIHPNQLQEKKQDVLIVFLAAPFFSMHYGHSNS